MYARRQVRSEYALPALPPFQSAPRPEPGSAVPPPITVVLHSATSVRREAVDWLHEWREQDGDVSLQLASARSADNASGCYLLRAPNVCDFIIDPATSTIEVDPHHALDAHTLEHLLIDQAIPRLLAQQGHLMVHASQIRVASGSVLFLGRSGWGKSTLAGLLHQRGRLALCDDCVLLEEHDGRPFGTPSYPGLRLYEDSIEQMGDVAHRLSPVAEYSDKQRVIDLDIPRTLLEAQPVLAIYVLAEPGSSDHDDCRIQPMSSANACMAVVEHSFRLDPTERGQTAQLLRQAAAITRGIPTLSLAFPHDFERRDDLIATLLAHIDSLTHPTP